MKFYDSSGKEISLGTQIGRGGEGTVFEVNGDPESVAKIYHQPPDAERADKLRWMSSLDDPQLRRVSAWIVEVILDRPDGDVVGFMMPRVGAKEIHELYSLKSRRVYFPQATWKFLIHTATNVARAFHSLHRNGHVMGDVNHGNCVVLPDGTVKLIDCDSYSLLREDRHYRCEIGVGTHLAPELQGSDLGEIERLPQHDNFGLAVIIFQLLFLGRHPFSGMFLGDEEKSLEECIRERRFAYAENAELLYVKQPPGTLSLSELTPRLATMFERAFLTDDRPEPREWIEALDDLSNSLTQCQVLGGHAYFNELGACPWCRLESETGLILFPIFGAKGADDFNIFTVENLLNDIRRRTELPTWPKPPEGGFHRSQKALDLSANFRFEAKKQIFIFSLLILALSVVLPFFVAIIISFVVMLILLRNFRSWVTEERMEFEVEEETAKRKLGGIRTEWMELDRAKSVPTNVGHLERLIDDYKGVQLELIDKARALKENSVRYQHDRRLSSFKISATGQFEPEELATIESLGILSAADVATGRSDGFQKLSPDLSEKLVAWKSEIEATLEVEQAEFPAVDISHLKSETSLRRKSLEQDIETLVFDIRRESAMNGARHKRLAHDAGEYLSRLSQAKVDLKTSRIPAFYAPLMVILSILLPATVGVSMLSVENAKRVRVKYGEYSTSGIENRNSAVNAPSADQFRPARNGTPYEFSDAEIAAMSPERKRLLSDDLEAMAATEIKNASDHKAAVKYLENALRMTPQNTDVLTKLSESYYGLGRYQDSIDMIVRANLLDFRQNDRAYTLARSRFELGHFSDAKKEFKKILEREPDRVDVSLYLGRTHRELGEYHAAVKELKKTVVGQDESGEALYHLAWCLNRIGSRAEAMTYSDRLKVIDRDRWLRLKSEIGKD